jgi:integrase/recombinase XerD
MADDLVLAFVSMQNSPRTRGMYASDLRDLASFAQAHVRGPLHGMQESDALAWRRGLEERGLSPVTIARKLAVARGFFSYVMDLDVPPSGIAPRNPFRRVHPPRFDRSVGKTPCPGSAEVVKLLGSMSPRSRRGRRDLLIALLLFNQGLRVSEVARLERSNVLRSGKRTYLALVGKGGSEVRSVLQDEVAALLDKHLRCLDAESRYLFSRLTSDKAAECPITPRAIHANLKRYAARAGLDPTFIRPHSGRVYFITQSYLKTRDLERVARAVGHRELATTRRYLRLGSALEDHPASLIELLPRRKRT